jgi:hypothetical protein
MSDLPSGTATFLFTDSEGGGTALWRQSRLRRGPIPAETNATCHDCAMSPRAGEAPGNTFFFKPASKCCTYWPELPNFLVGRILADEDPALAAGRARVAGSLQSINCTPRALRAPVAWRVLYRGGSGDVFGRAQALLCPYYQEEGGLCGIWRHRESTCATWFCKHVRGAVGRQFWRELQELLERVEQQLAAWCMLELDPGPEALGRWFALPADRNSPQPLDTAQFEGAADPAERRALWGRWWGREREYFEECAALVAPLSWEEVTALCGPEVRAFARLVRHAYAELVGDEIPARLQVGPIELIQIDPQRCRAVTYRAYDPLEFPRRLLDALSRFDGRPTEAALRAVEDQEGLRLHPSLVRKLVDFAVLVPPGDAKEAG